MNGLNDRFVKAVMQSDAAEVRDCLVPGTCVNSTNHSGWTALHFACSCAEPDVDRQDIRGHTALHLAVRSRDMLMTALLLDAGASIHLPNVEGDTPQALVQAHGGVEMRALLSQAEEQSNHPYDNENSLATCIWHRKTQSIMAGGWANRIGRGRLR